MSIFIFASLICSCVFNSLSCYTSSQVVVINPAKISTKGKSANYNGGQYSLTMSYSLRFWRTLHKKWRHYWICDIVKLIKKEDTVKKTTKKLIIEWKEKPRKAPKVVFAGCSGNCYSGTCNACQNWM